MGDETARDIYQRLNSIDRQLAELKGMLAEREKACADRHTSLDNVCVLAQEVRGGWKAVSIIAAVVGAIAGQLISYLAGRH